MERFGGVLILLGIAFGFAAIWVWLSMQTRVARLVPPRANRPWLDVFDAVNRKRILQEHTRLFPESKQRKFEKVTRILAIVCFVAGFIVWIGFARNSG
jgi:hypothetical protein